MTPFVRNIFLALALSSVAAGGVYAEDAMGKSDDAMHKDSTSSDAMKKDTMGRDTMKSDTMEKERMKSEAMGKESADRMEPEKK